jgi:hypothetical protein
MDVNVPRSITLELRIRGVAVVTAQEDGTGELSDHLLLDRAGSLGCVFFTHDVDFVREAVRRQRMGEQFAGIIYAHPLKITIGRCIEELELLARCSESEEWSDRLEYLPLA